MSAGERRDAPTCAHCHAPVPEGAGLRQTDPVGCAVRHYCGVPCGLAYLRARAAA